MNHWIDPIPGFRNTVTFGFEEMRQHSTIADWWEVSVQPSYMLWLLEKIAYPDNRKLRLLACRFIRETRVDDTRTVWDLLTFEQSKMAVEVAERYAEGQAAAEELAEEFQGSKRVLSYVCSTAEREAATAAWQSARQSAMRAAMVSLDSTAFAVQSVRWWAGDKNGASVPLPQHADIIRSMIPVEEIAPLFERYIERLQGRDQ